MPPGIICGIGMIENTDQIQHLRKQLSPRFIRTKVVYDVCSFSRWHSYKRFSVKNICLLFILLLFSEVGWSQDPVFSQFYATPLQLNPAFAGTTVAPRITLNHRSQWIQIEGGFRTYAATYEQSIENLNSGFGLILLTDNAMNGVYRTNQFSVVYGYRLKFNDHLFIKFGTEVGMIQNSLDWDRLQFGDQIDPRDGFVDRFGNSFETGEIRPAELSKAMLDISAGLLVYGNNFYGGISLKHLNQPDESFLEINQNLTAGLPLRLSLQAGMEISWLKGNNQKYPSFISPNVLYVQQAGIGQINVGAYAATGMVFGGLWYRQTFSNVDAAIALIGMRYSSLKMGYSFDFTLSKLAAGNPGGTHEISLTLNLDESQRVKQRKRSERFVDCFKMWR